MIKKIARRFAMSMDGARNLFKGIILSTVLNLALVLPGVFIFIFLNDVIQKETGIMENPSLSIWYYILIGVLFMVVIFVVGIFQYDSVYTSVYDESANRRINLAEKLRKLPLAFFGEKNLSDLTATLMDDCTDLEHTFSHAVAQMYASMISSLLICLGMMFYNWQLGLALFWVIPVSVGVVLLSRKKMQEDNHENYLRKRDVTETIQEGLDNVQEIHAYNRTEEYVEKLSRDIDRYEHILTRNELSFSVMLNGAQAFLKLGLASVILVGAYLLNAGSISIFVYLVFLVLGTCVYAPIIEVMNNLGSLAFLDVRIDRLREMDEMPVQQGEADFAPKDFNIEFKQVGFSYEEGKQVLEEVSFTAKQGEITALIGPSGCGKSTAAKLAARFWDIDRGQITLGGQDISKIDPETLLKYYSVVFQNVVLFNSSVMDNIRIGRRDASDEEVLQVAHLAQCDEFVEKLPEGYNTVIGENGATLSGGERQRISIARALLKDAPIVLLDEATASLDVENETKIQQSISELVKDKTVLVIAHRMRTIINSDKVVAICDGKVMESGKPAELLERDGYFAHMVKTQMRS